MRKEERLNIWRALSELFLDTEIDEVTLACIARTIEESGLSLDAVESILWQEVYPVLEKNLRITAGVWDGWTDEWLLEHLDICSKPKAIAGISSIISEIKRSWQRIVVLLPNRNA